MMLFSRFPLLAAAVSAIASAPAAAAPAPSPELTVYSGDYEALSGHGAGGYALVRDVLRRPLDAGGNTVKADNLPRALDVASVSLEAPDGVRVDGQRYEFALSDQGALMQRALGQTVTVEQFAGQSVLRETGVLLAAGSGLTLRLPDGRIRMLSHYANIELPNLPEGANVSPTMVWQLDANRAQTADLSLNYATAGLAWRAEYRANLISGSDCRLRLEAAAQVINRSGADFRNARLTLVAGEPNRVQDSAPGPKAMRAEVMMMSADAGVPTRESSSEYHAYPLPMPVDLPDESIQRLPLLTETAAANCLRRYQAGQPWRGVPGRPIIQREFGGDGPQPVRVGLELNNDKASGLGQPLPAGRVRVFEANGALLGEAQLQHTAAGSEIALDLGEAFDLSAERDAMEFELDRTGRTITERIQWTVRNGKDTPATVRINEALPRWSEWEIIETEQPWTRTDSQNIAFDVPIAAQSALTYSYVVRYRWPADIRLP